MSLCHYSKFLLIVIAASTLGCTQSRPTPQKDYSENVAATGPIAQSNEPYRALTAEDGLSCSFSQDISASPDAGLGGKMNAVKNHFTCMDKAKRDVELELVSAGLDKNGKLAIGTKKFGTVYRGNSPGTFDTYEMTDRQIKAIKTFLGL